MRSIKVVAVLAVLLVAVGARAQDEESGIAFAPHGKGFRIEFPGEPQVTTQESPAAVRIITTTIYKADLGAKGIYMVLVSESGGFFKSSAKELLDGVRNELSGQGTVVKDQVIKLGDAPGREFQVKMTAREPGDVLVTCRAYIDNVKMYQVLVSRAASSSPDMADAFFDSFQITDIEE